MPTAKTTTKKSPTPTEVSSASSWKKSSGVGAPLCVPSGNTCLVRPMNMQALMRKNLIPNELMGIITDSMKSKSGPSMDSMMDELTPDRMMEIMDTMDAVIIHMVVEPKIYPVPDNEENRDEDLLYIDEVNEEDKTFIWQYAVGGTRDVEKFRQGLQEYMEPMEQEQDVAATAE